MTLLDTDPAFSKAEEFALVSPLRGTEVDDERVGSVLARGRTTLRAMRKIRETWWPRREERHFPACLIKADKESDARRQAQVRDWKTIFPNLKALSVHASHVNFLNHPHVREVARYVDEFMHGVTDEHLQRSDIKKAA